MDKHEASLKMLADETDTVFLDTKTVRIIHDDLIERFGGTFGLRDETGLESVLKAPMMTENDDDASIAQRVATLVHRLVKTPPFVDGNKRTAMMALVVFLEKNGYALTASDPEPAQVVRSVASGDMDEDELARWVDHNSHDDEPDRDESTGLH